MARPLTQKAVTLFAGLALLGSIVACGGGGTMPAVSNAGGANPAAGAPVAVAASNRGALTANAVITTATYQNIFPLALYSGGGLIDFLVTSVTTAPVFSPLNTGTLSTNAFIVPATCAVGGGITTSASAKRDAAVTASATPAPTPQPTNLPVSDCLIVAYPSTGGPGIPVTGFASVDGSNLDFPATSPGISYTLGVTYTFYVAIAVATTPTPTPMPTPEPTPGTTGGGTGTWCHGGWHDGHGQHYGWYYKHKDDGSEWNHDDHGCDHNGHKGDEPEQNVGGSSCDNKQGDHGDNGRGNNGHDNGHGNGGSNCSDHGDNGHGHD